MPVLLHKNEAEVTDLKEINYREAMEITVKHLSGSGVFLTVGGDAPNTMTIGWATIGYIWKKPVFMALVRRQRHSWQMIADAGEFTLSVPTKNVLKDELLFAGTKSGRDYDKFNGHGITAAPAQKVNAPVVAECGIHFECKTLLQQDMSPEMMDDMIKTGSYPKEDYHTMFFGEIVACYSTDE